MELLKEHERLMELTGFLRDGGLDDAQSTELESMLENDPEALAYYVESVDVIAMLHRQQGLAVANRVDSNSHPITLVPMPARRNWWLAAVWSTAICASLAIGVLGGRLLLRTHDSSAREEVAANLKIRDGVPEIATLSSASACRWDPRDESRYEGQRLTAESLRLVEGIAVVHFDCDVNLVLEGPAHLDLASFDRAMLRWGKVVFSGDGDLDQFTLETPFSKIRDEGTEYAVSVDPQGEIEEIHVFDGRVICNPADRNLRAASDGSIQLDAGEARRFDGTSSIETIEVDSTRFIREPIVETAAADSTLAAESFAYDLESLVGRNGGTGWLSPWIQPSRFESNQNATVRRGESLPWPGRSENSGDGCLMIEGDTGLHRTLQEPIRMDRDAAYYLSFLIRKHSVQESTTSNGWTYITLRDPGKEKEKIAIGPTSTRGTPRIVHKGRAANATSPLRDDVVYLFVCKILARQDKEDQVLVRIYGDHETVDAVEPSAWSITSRPIRDDSVLSELRLYSQDSDPIQLDDIRIGKTWSSVTSEFIE